MKIVESPSTEIVKLDEKIRAAEKRLYLAKESLRNTELSIKRAEALVEHGVRTEQKLDPVKKAYVKSYDTEGAVKAECLIRRDQSASIREAESKYQEAFTEFIEANIDFESLQRMWTWALLVVEKNR
jgi:multidrug resistance efflux pump